MPDNRRPIAIAYVIALPCQYGGLAGTITEAALGQRPYALFAMVPAAVAVIVCSEILARDDAVLGYPYDNSHSNWPELRPRQRMWYQLMFAIEYRNAWRLATGKASADAADTPLRTHPKRR